MDDQRMDFSRALEVLKGGGLVARAGWHGRGMWVALMGWHGRGMWVALMPGGGNVAPYFSLWTGQGWQPGWVPSQADLLGDDWYVATVTYTAGGFAADALREIQGELRLDPDPYPHVCKLHPVVEALKLTLEYGVGPGTDYEHLIPHLIDAGLARWDAGEGAVAAEGRSLVVTPKGEALVREKVADLAAIRAK